jgi:RNA polymerase sigma factor (sigma-70 family)
VCHLFDLLNLKGKIMQIPANTQPAANANQEPLEALWDRYLAGPSEADRNELAIRYLAWTEDIARRIARRMAISDKENAVGDVVLKMAGSVIPSYNGTGKFENYAKECIKRTLISISRAEGPAMLSLDGRYNKDLWTELMTLAPEPFTCDYEFNEFLASLGDRAACLLWLRYYRGLSRTAAAKVFGVSVGKATRILRKAYVRLRRTPELAKANETYRVRQRTAQR